MRFINMEKRSQSGLFAFIDLLFLLVAFLVLVIFFIKDSTSEAEVLLESTQEQLATLEEKKSSLSETLAKMAPLLDQFAVHQQQETERRRKLSARDLRRKARKTRKLEYQVQVDGRIVHEGKTYQLARFKNEVVERLRKEHWIAFRAYAAPKTPFGTVVALRKELLEEKGEFDTYWDNVTQRKR